MASRTFRVAILGATTAAGQELGTALLERRFPVAELLFFGEGEDVGEVVEVGDDEYKILALEKSRLRGVDLAFVPPGAALTKDWLESLQEQGAVVIDGAGTAATEDALLVFPGINDEELEEVEGAKGRVFRLPSASAAQLAAVLLPLEARGGIGRAQVVCLEAVSTAGGIEGMEELSEQTVSLLNGKEPIAEAFPHRIAFNVIPQVEGFDPSGDTLHERRLVAEVRRLLDKESLSLSVTSVVVPVFYGAMQILDVSLERAIDPAAARELLREGELKVIDEPEEGVFPMPMLAVGDEAVQVGRVRASPAGLGLISVADALRWGTVVPMVRLAELLLEEELF